MKQILLYNNKCEAGAFIKNLNSYNLNNQIKQKVTFIQQKLPHNKKAYKMNKKLLKR